MPVRSAARPSKVVMFGGAEFGRELLPVARASTCMRVTEACRGFACRVGPVSVASRRRGSGCCGAISEGNSLVFNIRAAKQLMASLTEFAMPMPSAPSAIPTTKSGAIAGPPVMKSVIPRPAHRSRCARVQAARGGRRPVARRRENSLGECDGLTGDRSVPLPSRSEDFGHRALKLQQVELSKLVGLTDSPRNKSRHEALIDPPRPRVAPRRRLSVVKIASD